MSFYTFCCFGSFMLILDAIEKSSKKKCRMQPFFLNGFLHISVLFWGHILDAKSKEKLINMHAGMFVSFNHPKIVPRRCQNDALDVQIGRRSRFAWGDHASSELF